MPVFRGDTLRMKLYAVERHLFMGDTHHNAVLSLRRDVEAFRHGVPVQNERMITRHGQRAGQILEQTVALMVDLAQLAVHAFRRTDYFSAKRLSD